MGFFDPTRATALPTGFFDRDPKDVAPELLGTYLVSEASEGLAVGRIVETEAYLGSDDPGSHAATKGVTPRNATMYGPPGTVYVYFTYGNHHMVNLVCGPEGTAGAVLIRALEPVAGIALMERRRGERPRVELCNGPGKLAQAMGVEFVRGKVASIGEDEHQNPVLRVEVTDEGRIVERAHDLVVLSQGMIPAYDPSAVFQVKLGSLLDVFVRLVRMTVDSGGSDIETANDLFGLFLCGLRGERVFGLGCPTVDGAFEYNRNIFHRFVFK